MKLALMQPYFFPYLGYYQLACSVDKFVFYDDASFIKQGFINRNAILLNKQRFDFSLPVTSISSYRTIADHQYTGQSTAFLKQVRVAYTHAPYFDSIFDLVESVTMDQDLCVATKNARSITAVFDYLNINRDFSMASALPISDDIRGEARVIEVCLREQASDYHNSIGGKSLYSFDHFSSVGLKLHFIRSSAPSYAQGKAKTFTPYLSMIDTLMWCSPAQVSDLLGAYELESTP